MNLKVFFAKGDILAQDYFEEVLGKRSSPIFCPYDFNNKFVHSRIGRQKNEDDRFEIMFKNLSRNVLSGLKTRDVAEFPGKACGNKFHNNYAFVNVGN